VPFVWFCQGRLAEGLLQAARARFGRSIPLRHQSDEMPAAREDRGARAARMVTFPGVAT